MKQKEKEHASGALKMVPRFLEPAYRPQHWPAHYSGRSKIDLKERSRTATGTRSHTNHVQLEKKVHCTFSTTDGKRKLFSIQTPCITPYKNEQQFLLSAQHVSIE